MSELVNARLRLRGAIGEARRGEAKLRCMRRLPLLSNPSNFGRFPFQKASVSGVVPRFVLASSQNTFASSKPQCVF